MVGRLTTDRGGGTASEARVSGGTDRGPQAVALHGIGNVLGIMCMLYLIYNTVCMSRCGPRLSLS